ncbi:MAG: methionyl-tRNA formyltransferase [Nitrospinae bacterium]|nr:methionyl-tRNA formyltransferase [Nitrospinota bacterium]
MPAPIRVVFMGTPDFAVPTLEALIEHPSFDVLAVVTQPDKPKGRGKKLAPPPVKELALAHGIPVYQPVKAREPENVELLKALAPDYLVVVAYGQILPLSILSIPKLAPVNLHASLLPRWRGAAPIHRAFLAGDSVTGVCAMIMAEGLDTGDTLGCKRTEITDEDTVGRVHDRLAQSGAVLMAETLLNYKDGLITPEKQDDSKSTYAAKLTDADFVIDWSQPAPAVSLKIRGLSPCPAAVTKLSGGLIKPLFARVPQVSGIVGAPGEVLDTSAEGITVACGEGAIVITELKPENRGPMTAHAYTLGHKVLKGERFGE